MVRLVAISIVFSLAAPCFAQELTPIGDEFRANTYVNNSQHEPDVAINPRGDFVISWRSTGQGGPDRIFLQRFDADDAPVGVETESAPIGTFARTDARVGIAGDGSFVVVWQDTDGDSAGILARRFDSTGVGIGSEFVVSQVTAGGQQFPGMSALDDGRFMISWSTCCPDLDSSSRLVARAFGADGLPTSPETQVNAWTSGTQWRPAVAALPAGSFAVAWAGWVGPGEYSGVATRRIDSAATPLGAENLANSIQTGSQLAAAVASTPAGEFMVVWHSTEGDGDLDAVFGRAHDSAGTPIGPQFQVNSYTTSRQRYPDVAWDGEGFVVVWQSWQQDDSSEAVLARRFDSTGASLGAELIVNSYTSSSQREPSIDCGQGGECVVAFTTRRDPSTPASDGVWARRVGVTGRLFLDGFETTDLGRWSVTAP